MTPETAKLLTKVMLLLNDKKRFTLRRGGLDSFEVANEINQHMKANGFHWLDPSLQPPPASNLRR